MAIILLHVQREMFQQDNARPNTIGPTCGFSREPEAAMAVKLSIIGIHLIGDCDIVNFGRHCRMNGQEHKQ